MFKIGVSFTPNWRNIALFTEFVSLQLMKPESVLIPEDSLLTPTKMDLKWIFHLTSKTDQPFILTNCSMNCPRKGFFCQICKKDSTTAMIVAALPSNLLWTSVTRVFHGSHRPSGTWLVGTNLFMTSDSNTNFVCKWLDFSTTSLTCLVTKLAKMHSLFVLTLVTNWQRKSSQIKNHVKMTCLAARPDFCQLLHSHVKMK